MLDQLQPTTEQFASPTGLRVRQDLYDEDYSDEDYERMLSMYEGTMAAIVEGEIVKSRVLRVTENAVILDVRRPKAARREHPGDWPFRR